MLSNIYIAHLALEITSGKIFKEISFLLFQLFRASHTAVKYKALMDCDT
jgi:hypothetical protein